MLSIRKAKAPSTVEIDDLQTWLETHLSSGFIEWSLDNRFRGLEAQRLKRWQLVAIKPDWLIGLSFNLYSVSIKHKGSEIITRVSLNNVCSLLLATVAAPDALPCRDQLQ